MLFILFQISKYQAISGSVDPIANRPRFFTTVPSGVYLPPAKELPHAPKLRHPQTYAYFSIPKIFAQNIDKGNKLSPIEQIHAIKTTNTYDKTGKLRYVFHLASQKHHPRILVKLKRIISYTHFILLLSLSCVCSFVKCEHQKVVYNVRANHFKLNTVIYSSFAKTKRIRKKNHALSVFTR